MLRNKSIRKKTSKTLRFWRKVCWQESITQFCHYMACTTRASSAATLCAYHTVPWRYFTKKAPCVLCCLGFVLVWFFVVIDGWFWLQRVGSPQSSWERLQLHTGMFQYPRLCMRGKSKPVSVEKSGMGGKTFSYPVNSCVFLEIPV